MHNVIRIFVEGKIKPQTPIKMLAKLGFNNPEGYSVESMLKILRDNYGIELVSVPTIQDTIMKVTELELKRIGELKSCFPEKQKNFSPEQLKHFNRLQNTRFKIANQRHR